MIGWSIAHYTITEKIGQGGMGEVYRATDTKLKRDVALKVLPESFTQDTQRVARFRREAEVLASLNHSNIGAIHGLEESGTSQVLVLELIEGDTLEERIAQGPIPLEEALKLALQIAEALDAAHEKGVIHRDLKPANIKITPDGKVKVLDFGLAKAMEEGPGSSPDLSQSPTLTMQATQAGVILGTAAYMSPEQARGEEVDKRADVWSFGVVLFEVLTGRQTFREQTISDTMAAVLKVEPDWKATSSLPAPIRRLLRRCLRKERGERLRDVGDARIVISDFLADPDPVEPAARATEPRRSRLTWGALGILAGGILAWSVSALVDRSPPPAVSHLTLSLAPSSGLDSGSTLGRPGFAISPDGTKVAFVGRVDAAGPMADPTSRQIFVRALQDASAVALPGTQGARSPVFSSDGAWIAFLTPGGMSKVPVDGGPVVPICECGGNFLSWGPDDSIAYSGVRGGQSVPGLYRVSADGGVPERLFEVQEPLNPLNTIIRRPLHLPNSRFLLYSLSSLSDPNSISIEALDLDTGVQRTLLSQGIPLGYVSSGHLIFSRASNLIVVGLDSEDLRLIGSPRLLLENVAHNPADRVVHAAVSANGTLVYLPGHSVGLESGNLFWVDLDEGPRNLGGPAFTYVDPRLSPDGKRIAMSVELEGNEIWVRDVNRGSQTRITFDPGEDETPIWSPDGESVIWAAVREGDTRTLRRKRADGTGDEEVLWESEYHFHASSITPDGGHIIGDLTHPSQGFDIWSVDLESREGRPLLTGPYHEALARLSPDGLWLAYMSDETGQPEIYALTYPSLKNKVQVSIQGGTEPVWSRDGRRLFYRSDRGLMAVDIGTAAGALSPGPPSVLLEMLAAFSKGFAHFGYDAAPDGRFLVTLASTSQYPDELRIVLNWGSLIEDF